MIFLKYRRRGENTFCPECGSPIKWVYTGINWIPCNAEPVYFYPSAGNDVVFYRGDLTWNAKLYRPGMGQEERPLAGLRPHVFTCRKDG